MPALCAAACDGSVSNCGRFAGVFAVLSVPARREEPRAADVRQTFT
jgi:hypothetical protein